MGNRRLSFRMELLRTTTVIDVAPGIRTLTRPLLGYPKP